MALNKSLGISVKRLTTPPATLQWSQTFDVHDNDPSPGSQTDDQSQQSYYGDSVSYISDNETKNYSPTRSDCSNTPLDNDLSGADFSEWSQKSESKVTSRNEKQYTDDFESEVNSKIEKQYSDDFETDITSRTLKQYSDDFESELNSRTGIQYTEDFETELTRTDAHYSDDFDSEISSELAKRQNRNLVHKSSKDMRSFSEEYSTRSDVSQYYRPRSPMTAR